MSTEDRSDPRPGTPAPAISTPESTPGQAPGTAPANPATTPSEPGGMVTPQGAPPPATPAKRTVEEHAQAKGHHGADAWKLAAARALHGWPAKAEVSEFDYDAAIDAAAEIRLS